MAKPYRHPWNVTPASAREIQEELRDEVVTRNRIGRVRFVAGVDVAFDTRTRSTHAAAAVLTFPGLELHECAHTQRRTSFPYVPGLLSFREAPAILDAMKKLKQKPDLILVDGQGIAHPKRFGIASHLGVLSGLPTIGVAKSRLIGSHDPLPEEKGNWVPLLDRGEKIGAVLRTRSRVKPLYVSIGHRIRLSTAIDYVMKCLTRFRLPETTRWAHKLVTERAKRRATKA
jgi:deoxyribonuclease V